jgi:tetrahydromethanopterin S-methyltransferase subunit G
MRRRFNAAMQPAQEVFAAGGAYGGTAPQTTNATIALTIAKAEAQYAEIRTRISEVEATIAELARAKSAARLNQPPPLTVQQADQITKIFIVIREQPAVPTQAPAHEVNEAPGKLDSFTDHLKKYADNFFTEASKSAGKKVGTIIGAAIPVGAIVYLLIDQLTALSSHISDWLSTIATLLG